MDEDRRIEDQTVFKKHNDMIVMKPTKGGLSLVGRRVYYLLMAQAQLQMNGVTPLATHVFELPLSELLSIGTTLAGQGTHVKKYLREMKGFEVDWESTVRGDGVKYAGISMLSQVKLIERNGREWVSWAFPPDVISMILNPDAYSRLNLKIITSIKCYAGTALYDICARYRDVPSGKTSRQTTVWWMDALSQTAPEVGVKREWRQFKYLKLQSAIDFINDETDIEIELLEFKEGKAITEVQFNVQKKKTFKDDARTNPVNPEQIAEIEKLAKTVGAQMARIEPLIREFGEEQVLDKLFQLIRRTKDQTKPPIESNIGYLKTILLNDSVSTKKPPVAKQEKIKASKNDIFGPDPGTTASKEDGRVDVPVSIRHEIRVELNGMSEYDRRQWIERAIQQLRDRGTLTSRDLKHSELSSITPGVFGAVVVELYGKATRGDQWEVLLSLQK